MGSRQGTWIAAALATVLGLSCSQGPAPCDPNACRPGNECLSDGTTTACRLVCATQDDCPGNFHCAKPGAAAKAFCTADTRSFRDPSQWGKRCDPRGGVDANPDCDAEVGFWCKADGPSDASAFCTQFDCASDADCRGDYYCATIDRAPNAYDPTPSFHETWTACLPRGYCAPCRTDLDCAKAQDGSSQHCLTDITGSARLCAPECATDSNCALDAACQDNDEVNARVCVPRAGVCVGDGSLCAPCRSDADCSDDGLCASAAFSTERFCSVKSKTSCATSAAGCPKRGDGGGVTCTQSDSPGLPKDQCVGYVNVGAGNPQLGCWSKPR
jgi:hypothetical protein